MCENIRVIATMQLRSWFEVTAERLVRFDMATKYKILIDGEEDDEGNTFDTESEADDYAL